MRHQNLKFKEKTYSRQQRRSRIWRILTGTGAITQSEQVDVGYL